MSILSTKSKRKYFIHIIKTKESTVPVIHQMNIRIPKITPSKLAISTLIPFSLENDRARRITKIHLLIKNVH
jgi:hypothetical protein